MKWVIYDQISVSVCNSVEFQKNSCQSNASENNRPSIKKNAGLLHDYWYVEYSKIPVPYCGFTHLSVCFKCTLCSFDYVVHLSFDYK